MARNCYAAHTWHRNIQKDPVRMQAFTGCNCFNTVRRFETNIESQRLSQSPQAISHRGIVISYDQPQTANGITSHKNLWDSHLWSPPDPTRLYDTEVSILV